MSAQQRRDEDLAASRARLVTHLQGVLGPALTRAEARTLLERAAAWAPRSARQLDRHLLDNPDAFSAPSPHCPASLARLLRVLHVAGHGQAVTPLGCARCGRTDRPLPRITPAGRCCDWCLERENLRECARCHMPGHIVAHRPDGPICRRCYTTDAAVLQECGRCGRRRRPCVRAPDGTPWCSSCAPRPQRPCVRCAKVGQVEAITAEGPLCRDCHQPPARPCGICGQVRPVHVRGAGEEPDICASCYRGPIGTCVACDRRRPGFRHRGGAFYCASCQPRPSARCQDCGRTRATKVSGWPIGVLCGSCYSRRKRNPQPCTRCGTPRVLVGRAPDGADLCGPCSGADELDFTCPRCNSPGQIHADGACARCVLTDRLHDALGGGGARPSPLQPLIDALSKADKPHSVLDWLASSPSAAMLGQLASDHSKITHDLIDALSPDATTRHVRQSLVATGILPPRNENLAGLQLWTTQHTEALPAHQSRIIRPFAEWQVLRDARRRAARGRYTSAAAAHDRTDIRTATAFLTWLDTNQDTLDTTTQADVDLWLTTHRTRHRRLATFIRWTTARRLTSRLEVPPQPTGLPTTFLSATEHADQLRRCLNDTTLPREARITGALIRLYGLPLTRIHDLTTDQFHRDADGAYLTLDRFPVLLPPKLATLIAEQIDKPARTSVLPNPATDRRYLMPGRPPSRPRSTSALHKLMARHGLPTLGARNTAMIEAVSAMPPIIISDLFGISPGTVNRWAQYAQDSWADYLATNQALAPGHQT